MGRSARKASALKKFAALIEASPSPELAARQLERLGDGASANGLAKIPTRELPTLFQLLGSSSFLGDVLIRQEEHWAEFFLRQIAVQEKSVDQHARDIAAKIDPSASFEEVCAALRRYKHEEYLRIGARDLMAAV